MNGIEICKYDTPWKAKARKYQSDFMKQEMEVMAVKGRYGNVISKENGAKGVNFYPPFWDEIKRNLKGRSGAILTNVLRSEHIPYNIFFPMRHDLKKAALLFRDLTGKDVATVQNIIIEYKPLPKKKYLNDSTSFDTYVIYEDSTGSQCGIGIEVKYTEQGYRIVKAKNPKSTIRTARITL